MTRSLEKRWSLRVRAFTNEFAITVEDVACTLQGLSLETPSQLAEEAAKRGRLGKQMHFMEELKRGICID